MDYISFIRNSVETSIKISLFKINSSLKYWAKVIFVISSFVGPKPPVIITISTLDCAFFIASKIWQISQFSGSERAESQQHNIEHLDLFNKDKEKTLVVSMS